MVKRNESTDERVVYGFFCSWWGGIEETGPHFTKTPGLPGCPVCGHGLLQVDSAAEWWRMVDKKAETVEGYRDFISWLKGKCYFGPDGKGFHDALAAYNAKPGRKKVVL